MTSSIPPTRLSPGAEMRTIHASMEDGDGASARAPGSSTARRSLDVGLRLGLAGLWIGVAIWGDPTALEAPRPAVWALRTLLALGAASALAGWASRAGSAAGSLLAWALAPAGWRAWLGIVLAGAVVARLALAAGRGGAWLRRVQALQGARARALLATELARARAARAADAAARARALAEAGDAYEQAGRLRRRLLATAARPAHSAALVRPAGFALARLLGPLPALGAALERRLRGVLAEGTRPPTGAP